MRKPRKRGKKKKEVKPEINLMRLIDRFSCEEKCREFLERLRWPEEVCCTRCGDVDLCEIPKRNKWACLGCGYHFSVTAGTIMHDSHLPLRKWFIAVYMMVESKKGVSANQLKRVLGVHYKTAWYLCHRIREALAHTEIEGPTLFGVVEVDETLIGGKQTGVGRGNRDGKVYVAGAVQRGGKIRLESVPNIKKKTLHGFIDRHVKDEAEAIYTDELASYLGIEDHDTRHETVRHSIKQWVVGDVHTNSVEGVWSLFKRSIVGAFHRVSVKHLDRYLEELEWRFNNRDNPYIFRDALRKIVHAETMTYRELVDGKVEEKAEAA